MGGREFSPLSTMDSALWLYSYGHGYSSIVLWLWATAFRLISFCFTCSSQCLFSLSPPIPVSLSPRHLALGTCYLLCALYAFHAFFSSSISSFVCCLMSVFAHFAHCVYIWQVVVHTQPHQRELLPLSLSFCAEWEWERERVSKNLCEWSVLLSLAVRLFPNDSNWERDKKHLLR